MTMQSLPKPTPTQKRALSGALKRLQGKSWHAGMKPIYDERGFASIMISRFDPILASAITEFPAIHWLELHVDSANEPEDIRLTISKLLAGSSPYLEYLEITNTLDVTQSTEMMRDILPEAAGQFGRLPSIQSVVFNRVHVSDRIVKELCKNRSIESIDIREAPITKRVLRYFAACPNLKYLDLTRCPHFSAGCQHKVRERLPAVEFIHIN